MTFLSPAGLHEPGAGDGSEDANPPMQRYSSARRARLTISAPSSIVRRWSLRRSRRVAAIPAQSPTVTDLSRSPRGCAGRPQESPLDLADESAPTSAPLVKMPPRDARRSRSESRQPQAHER